MDVIIDTDSLCSISETRIIAEIVKEPVTVSYKNRVPTFTATSRLKISIIR